MQTEHGHASSNQTRNTGTSNWAGDCNRGSNVDSEVFEVSDAATHNPKVNVPDSLTVDSPKIESVLSASEYLAEVEVLESAVSFQCCRTEKQGASSLNGENVPRDAKLNEIGAVEHSDIKISCIEDLDVVAVLRPCEWSIWVLGRSKVAKSDDLIVLAVKATENQSVVEDRTEDDVVTSTTLPSRVEDDSCIRAAGKRK